MGAYNTVKLKSYNDITEEYVAASATTPGYLIEITSAGKVQNHSSSEGSVLPMFALEDNLQGNGVDDDYAADDQVQCWVPNRGDIVWAILADGENASIGSFLESAGNGKLQVHVADVSSFESDQPVNITNYPQVIVGQALQAVNISDSSGAESSGDQGYDKRIKVRII